MSRLDVEFMDETMGFLSANEEKKEAKILQRIIDKDYENLSGFEYEQLSDKRKGVLEWYPFKSGASLLELGAGMGALTSLFVKKKCKITCVEIKKSRVDIIKKRFEHEKNIEVICDNPVLYSTDKKFDYIVLHDIWGYIKKYNKIENAYDFFLRKIKSFLKEDGHIIIIADNRIGLKYLSGSIDEYSKKLFVGVNGYRDYNYIRSFDKGELIDMMKKNDLFPFQMYYVNSDYYFADKIYTDEAFNYIKYKGRKFSTTYNSFSFYDNEILENTLQNNGIIDKFVDAFILDYCNDGCKRKSISYYQVGNKNQNGIAIILEHNKGQDCIIKKEIDKEERVYLEPTVITIEEWRNIVEEYSVIDEELSGYIKGNVKMPYIDPVDILQCGIERGMGNICEDDLQLINEKKLIQRFVGDMNDKQKGNRGYC